MPLFLCVKYLNKNTHNTYNFYFNFSIIAVKLFFLLMAFKYASTRNAINFQENSGCFLKLHAPEVKVIMSLMM